MMNNLEIIEISDLGQKSIVQEFVSLRNKVRAEEYQVGGPSEEQTTLLMHWGVANQAKFWIIKDDQKKTIGRICARVSSHISNHGCLGFFELDLNSTHSKQAFSELTKIALDWLYSQNVINVAAPVDMNTWFNYRFSVFGKKFWPRLTWEPTTPPEYLELFKASGFDDFAYYHTIYFPHFRIGNFCLGTGPMQRSYAHLIQQGFKLRPFDNERFMTHEVPIFHEISHEAFSEALLFEPIDLSTFSSLYAGAVKSYDFSPSSVLISPKGEIAGFIFAFYDKEYLVIKSIAIRKKYQGLNLSSGMIYNAVKQALPLKKKGTISALVKTGIASEGIEKNVKKTLWFSWSHYYVLLKKELHK